MISDETVPVLVDHTPADDPAPRARADRVIAASKAGRPVSTTELRYLQPFMATLTRKALATAPKASAENGQALVVGTPPIIHEVCSACGGQVRWVGQEAGTAVATTLIWMNTSARRPGSPCRCQPVGARGPGASTRSCDGRIHRADRPAWLRR